MVVHEHRECSTPETPVLFIFRPQCLEEIPRLHGAHVNCIKYVFRSFGQKENVDISAWAGTEINYRVRGSDGRVGT